MALAGSSFLLALPSAASSPAASLSPAQIADRPAHIEAVLFQHVPNKGTGSFACHLCSFDDNDD